MRGTLVQDREGPSSSYRKRDPQPETERLNNANRNNRLNDPKCEPRKPADQHEAGRRPASKLVSNEQDHQEEDTVGLRPHGQHAKERLKQHHHGSDQES